MRRILRQIDEPRDERLALLTDAAGVIALFVLFYAALHLPLIA
jgi:hypothetical protein